MKIIVNNYAEILLFLALPCATRTGGGFIRHDKRHACYYCSTLITNVWRHYHLQHSGEVEVQNILCSKHNEKKRAINRLRMLGDYYHNVQVLSKKSGQLIVVRRPSSNKQASYRDFLPCVGCKGFFWRKELWRHCKSCESWQTSQQPETACQKVGSMLLAPVLYTAANIDPALAAVLASMASDQVSLVAKNDCIILTFGSIVAQNCTTVQYNYVSQRMRQLARLLMELRDQAQAPNADLSSFLKPEQFDTVVAAVQKVCEYTQCTQAEPAKLKVPSLALKLGHALRKCCTLLINKALREKNAALEGDAESFMRMLDSIEWKTKVSSIAMKTITCEKRNKPDLIPLTADLVKIKTYLESAIPELSDRLTAEPNTENYVNLVDCLVSRIILFNKRRGGEVARMTRAVYENVSKPTAGASGLDDIAKTLSRTEQELCSRLKLVEIAGKRNQTVPVLLTQDVIKGIDSILANRTAVGINPSNLFVFARCSGLNSSDPFAAVRRVAQCAGAERPELVRSTKLRKYVATVSQVLDMQPSELNLLCRHMGHSIHVHEDFYRLPSQTLELAKVSKLLLAVEAGDLAQLNGKTLNNLDIADIPDACLEEDDDEDDDEADTVDKLPSTSTQSFSVSDRNEDGDIAVVDDVEPSGDDESDDDNDVPLCKKRRKMPVHKRDMKDSQVLPLPRRSTKRCPNKPWAAAEKDALFKHFVDNIRSRTVPGKKECEAARSKFSVLSSREWRHIKFAVKNIISAEKRLAV